MHYVDARFETRHVRLDVGEDSIVDQGASRTARWSVMIYEELREEGVHPCVHAVAAELLIGVEDCDCFVEVSEL